MIVGEKESQKSGEGNKEGVAIRKGTNIYHVKIVRWMRLGLKSNVS